MIRYSKRTPWRRKHMPGLFIKASPDLHEKLRESAARHHRSLAEEALAILEEVLSQPPRDMEMPRAFQGQVPLSEEILDRAKRSACL
jgi:plasmid stability protein